MTTKTIESILERTLSGYDLSPTEGVVLLQQTEPETIAAIRDTADKLRQKQAGDTVTSVSYTHLTLPTIYSV